MTDPAPEPAPEFDEKPAPMTTPEMLSERRRRAARDHIDDIRAKIKGDK